MMAEFQSTLELVPNEEIQRHTSNPEISVDDIIEQQEAEFCGRKRKLPSIVEGDFSPLGLTSIQRNFRSKIREVRTRVADGSLFAWGFLQAATESILWIGCLAIGTVVPVIMIVLGSAFVNRCAKIPSLPIILLVEGILVTLEDIVNAIDYFASWKASFVVHLTRDQRALIVGGINCVTNILATILLIFFTLLIFLTSTPDFTHETSPDYCNPMLYKFTRWIVNLFVVYSLFIVLLIVAGSLMHYFRAKVSEK